MYEARKSGRGGFRQQAKEKWEVRIRNSSKYGCDATSAEIMVSQPHLQEEPYKLQGTVRQGNYPSPGLLYSFPHFYNYLL